jgi:hypothetical protein
VDLLVVGVHDPAEVEQQRIGIRAGTSAAGWGSRSTGTWSCRWVAAPSPGTVLMVTSEPLSVHPRHAIALCPQHLAA